MTAPSPTVVEVVLAHRFARYPGICRCGGRWSGKHVAQALADAGVLGPEQAADLRAERDAMLAKVERVEAYAEMLRVRWESAAATAQARAGLSDEQDLLRYGSTICGVESELRDALRGES